MNNELLWCYIPNPAVRPFLVVFPTPRFNHKLRFLQSHKPVLVTSLIGLGPAGQRGHPLLPDPHLCLYAYVRKEAVVSSQIEGAQSSLSDLLLFELEEALGAPSEDVVEVSNYVAALERLRSCSKHGV